MSRLDRYIVREMIVPILVGTFVILLMFQANAYIYIAKTFNVDNIPLVARFQWIMYQTPEYARMTLPVGMSLAASLAMTRMARESELTALRAAGTRILRVIFPIFIMGVAIGAANFYIVDSVVPVSSRKAHDLERKNAFLGMSTLFKSNTLIQLKSFGASLGTVQKLSNDVLTVTNIALFDRSDPKTTVIVSAKEGRYDRGVWTFKGAYYYQIDGIKLLAARTEDMTIDSEINLDELLGGMEGLSVEEETTPQLRKDIAIARASKTPSRPAEVELAERYAVPASCAIFALTGSAFAVFFARTGGFAGVLVSFFAVVLYYNAFVISTQILGKIDSVPPWLAAWLPNILFGLIGVVAVRRLE